MGLTVAAAALAVALARGSLITRLRRAASLISRLGGLLALVAGGYVAYYGWWETQVLAGTPTTTDPVIDTAASVQQWLASGLDRAGPGTVAAVVAMLLAGSVAAAWAAARRSRTRVDR